MAKTCNYPGCLNLVFGKGYCKSHQYLRSDSKAPKPPRSSNSTSIKRTPIKKKFKKKTGELDVFERIWEERNIEYYSNALKMNIKNRKCEVSGTILPKFNPYYFHHLVTKGSNESLRLDPDNIIMIAPWVHDLLHSTKALSDLVKEDPRFNVIVVRTELIKSKYVRIQEEEKARILRIRESSSTSS